MELVPKVTVLPVVTTLDIAAERVLTGALESELQGCFVIGVNPDGSLYFASSMADGGDVLWWMAVAKKQLLEVGA